MSRIQTRRFEEPEIDMARTLLCQCRAAAGSIEIFDAEKWASTALIGIAPVGMDAEICVSEEYMTDFGDGYDDGELIIEEMEDSVDSIIPEPSVLNVNLSPYGIELTFRIIIPGEKGFWGKKPDKLAVCSVALQPAQKLGD